MLLQISLNMTTLQLRIGRDGYIPEYKFLHPEIVGFYSLHKVRDIHFDAGNLKYLRNIDFESELDLDLNVGFESYIPKPITMDNEEKVDSLLQWLIDQTYLPKIVNPQANHSTFICFRGLLSTIMKTPYEQQEDWLICATKVKNLIFLSSFYTDKKKSEIQRGQTEKDRRFEYWGRKFEHYMLIDKPNVPPNISEPVDANEEFCQIYRSKLNNKHDIIYGAEVDGVESQDAIEESPAVDTLNKIPFVELKTTRVIGNERQHRNFVRYKLLKWWVQSYTVGIEKIVCGERDDNGILRKLTDYKTQMLPQLAQQWWNPRDCMAFLDDFLSFIERTLSKESDFTTWRFDFSPPGKYIRAKKVTSPETYNILPEWFINECKKSFEEQK